MNIKVTKIQVSVIDKYVLNDKEYNINKCYFTFSEEYTDNLVKKAIFEQNGAIIEEPILNNECMIPSEVLNRGTFELRVYAYEVEDNELILRYSPTPTIAYVRSGSYIEGAESPEVITPSQFEQYMQALNDGLVEVQNVDIDAEQLDDGIKVTITNRNDEEKEVFVSNGEQGQPGPAGPEGPAGKDGAIQYTAGDNITIENNVISATGADLTDYYTKQETNTLLNGKANTSDIPTKVSQLQNDSGFITNQVNNLANYYTKTEIDNTIGNINTALDLINGENI